MNKIRKLLRKEDGFSLTEMVVATFLVTVGLMSVAAVMVTVANRQNLSQSLTTATNLATTKLEQIKSAQYDQVESSVDNYGEINEYPTYRRQTVVTPNIDDSLKVVQVTVTNATGINVSMETVVVR